jgi:putative ABC transport system permease protein
MSLWRHLTRGGRALIASGAADRDAQEEAQHFIDEAVAMHVAGGLSPEEARRVARLELGTALGVREEVRASAWENIVSTTLADLRYGARRLRESPGFTVVAVATLALGIGASTTIFSAVNPILFEPLPYPQARRLATVWDRTPDGRRVNVTYGTYSELLARSRSFDALAATDNWQPTIVGGAEPERLEGERVTASCFRAFGVAPALGRDFADADAVAGGPRVAILSDRLVQRRFAGPNGVVGRAINLDGDQYTVVGIMPPGFENVLAPLADIWTPMRYRMPAPFQGGEWGHHLEMAGRLKPGVTVEQAARELDAIARTPVPEFARPAWASLRQGLIVAALRDDVARGVKPVLIAIVGAVLLVLAIACVNVVNLLLARAAQRRGEFAMRAALGASRGRVLRQLLTESLLLAGIGGAIGLLAARFGVDALVALTPPGLPRAAAIRLDGAVFAFAFALTTAVGAAVGLLPALAASGGALQTNLQQSGRTTTGHHHALRRALVVAEIALAIVLLVGAGLLLRSLSRLLTTPPGFDASHVLTVQVEDARRRDATGVARRRFFDEVLTAVRAAPGVTSAGFTSQLPLSGELDGYGVAFESLQSGDRSNVGSALRYAVSPGYLETMRIPLENGRLIDAHDVAGRPEAVLINDAFAKRLFGDRDPIGQQLRMGPEIDRADRPWDVVVGVVGDVKQTSLALGEPDAVYVASAQWVWADPVQSLVVRTPLEPSAVLSAVRQAIWSVDKDQPIIRIAPMSELVERSEAERRFALTVFEAFGLAALALAAIGIYGVLAGSVTERTREIGVRSALGASRRAIVELIVRQALVLTAIGAVVGLGGALLASRAIDGLLFGVSRADPATYGGVVVLLAAVAAIACWVPAWRAARINPAVTLRAE